MMPFPGFPSKPRLTPLPDSLFTHLLPEINDLGELKVTLYVLWLLARKRGPSSFVTTEELARDRELMRGLGDGRNLLRALEGATRRGTLLPLTLEKGGRRDRLFFLNSPSGREARE